MTIALGKDRSYTLYWLYSALQEARLLLHRYSESSDMLEVNFRGISRLYRLLRPAAIGHSHSPIATGDSIRVGSNKRSSDLRSYTAQRCDACASQGPKCPPIVPILPNLFRRAARWANINVVDFGFVTFGELHQEAVRLK